MSATRILLVDDDVLLRAALAHRLRALRPGWSVTIAGDGQAALRSLKSETFDVVVTDILMPNVDGIELLMALRAAASTVKIVAMTGGATRSGKGPLQVARRLGAHEALEKPFETEALVRAIETLVGTTPAH